MSMNIETFVAGQLCGFTRSPNRNVFVDVSNIEKIFDDRILKITEGDDVIYRYEKLTFLAIFGVAKIFRNILSSQSRNVRYLTKVKMSSCLLVFLMRNFIQGCSGPGRQGFLAIGLWLSSGG